MRAEGPLRACQPQDRFPMIKTLLAAAALTIGLAGYAVAQEAAPPPAAPMAHEMHHHHHHHHHMHHEMAAPAPEAPKQ